MNLPLFYPAGCGSSPARVGAKRLQLLAQPALTVCLEFGQGVGDGLLRRPSVLCEQVTLRHCDDVVAFARNGDLEGPDGRVGQGGTHLRFWKDRLDAPSSSVTLLLATVSVFEVGEVEHDRWACRGRQHHGRRHRRASARRRQHQPNRSNKRSEHDRLGRVVADEREGSRVGRVTGSRAETYSPRQQK